MRLTSAQLRNIIAEEVAKVLGEGPRRGAVTPAEKLVGDTVADVTGIPELASADWRATAKELLRLRRQQQRRAEKPRKYRPGEEWKEKYAAEYAADRQRDELSSHLQSDIDAAAASLGLEADVYDDVFMSATAIGRKLLATAAAGQFDV